MDYDYDLEDDAKLFSWVVSLSNEPSYRTTVTVQGVMLYILVGYNTRNKSRWIIITDKSGNIILRQTFLKHRKICELEPISHRYNLKHYVTLRLIDNNKTVSSEHDYLNWGDNFNLCFVGYEYELEERLQKNIRINLVGN